MLRWPLPLDLWFVLFCRRRGASIVLTVHDLLPHDTAETHRHLFQDLYHQVDALICHSDHIKTRLAAEFLVPPEDITVIPHGPFFYDLPASDPGPTRRALNIPPPTPSLSGKASLFPTRASISCSAHGRSLKPPSPMPPSSSSAPGPPISSKRHAPRSIASVSSASSSISASPPPKSSSPSTAPRSRRLSLPRHHHQRSSRHRPRPGENHRRRRPSVFRELLTDGLNARLIDPLNPAAFAAVLIALLQDENARRQLAAAVLRMNFGAQSWHTIAASTMRLYVGTLLHTPHGMIRLSNFPYPQRLVIGPGPRVSQSILIHLKSRCVQ